MVYTRSRTVKNTLSGMDGNDRYSDNDSECSVPEVFSRDQIADLDSGNLISTERSSEQRTIDQRFIEMNRQINDLTGLVLALTEKITSNVGEGNGINSVSDKNGTRSDRMINEF